MWANQSMTISSIIFACLFFPDIVTNLAILLFNVSTPFLFIIGSFAVNTLVCKFNLNGYLLILLSLICLLSNTSELYYLGLFVIFYTILIWCEELEWIICYASTSTFSFIYQSNLGHPLLLLPLAAASSLLVIYLSLFAVFYQEIEPSAPLLFFLILLQGSFFIFLIISNASNLIWLEYPLVIITFLYIWNLESGLFYCINFNNVIQRPSISSWDKPINNNEFTISPIKNDSQSRESGISQPFLGSPSSILKNLWRVIKFITVAIPSSLNVLNNILNGSEKNILLFNTSQLESLGETLNSVNILLNFTGFLIPSENENTEIEENHTELFTLSVEHISESEINSNESFTFTLNFGIYPSLLFTFTTNSNNIIINALIGNPLNNATENITLENNEMFYLWILCIIVSIFSVTSNPNIEVLSFSHNFHYYDQNILNQIVSLFHNTEEINISPWYSLFFLIINNNNQICPNSFI